MGSIGLEKQESTKHYNDWPNTQGFDARYEEIKPIELEVHGQIPAYTAGTLFRTGIGPRVVESKGHKPFHVNHWFDSFSQIHRFQIHAPIDGEEKVRVSYNSRLVTDGMIKKIEETGTLDGYTFAARYDPCKSLFQKVQSLFLPAAPLPAPDEANVGVTMSVNMPGLTSTGQPHNTVYDDSRLESLCVKTDANSFKMLDPETLEPIGLASQEVLHPSLKGVGSAAHAKSDPVTGDVFNFNLDFGRKGTYRVFKVSATTGKTSILAKIQYNSAYLHSIFLSENYVILCIWNSFYKAGGASILWTKNLLDSMIYDTSQPCKWFVIDKRSPEQGGRGVMATYESNPFFAFHTINAYEEESADGVRHIIADIPAYDGMDVMNRFYFHNVLSDSLQAQKYTDNWGEHLAPSLRRYRLCDIPNVPRTTVRKAVLEFESDRKDTPELPTLNWFKFTKKHRFVYGIMDSGKSTFVDGLVKYDMETHTTLKWSNHGHTAGEAIFVADPASQEEDSGVLLSVVLDGIAGKSYLLVLDARTMTELGRASVDGVIGFGYHGIHTRQGLGDSTAASTHY